jgi:hypothetical protein
MHFKVSARTILQLGRELISSDGVAFYELIKNAFDAQELAVKKAARVRKAEEAPHKEVWVRVTVRLPYPLVVGAREKLAKLGSERAEIRALGIELASTVNNSVEGGEELVEELSQAKTISALNNALDNASSIEFEDLGEGMSPKTLTGVYLLIGTPSRRDQQADSEEHVFLGEKGIGRLWQRVPLGRRCGIHWKSTGVIARRRKNWRTLEFTLAKEPAKR